MISHISIFHSVVGESFDTLLSLPLCKGTLKLLEPSDRLGAVSHIFLGATRREYLSVAESFVDSRKEFVRRYPLGALRILSSFNFTIFVFSSVYLCKAGPSQIKADVVEVEVHALISPL